MARSPRKRPEDVQDTENKAGAPEAPVVSTPVPQAEPAPETNEPTKEAFQALPGFVIERN